MYKRQLIPPILPFSIGIAGRPYNSVSTTVLHCDCKMSNDEELSAEPRQLQLYMYEPLAADSAAYGHFTAASDPDDSECVSCRDVTHAEE